MAGRIPPGTRDVLPEEARELRAIEDALFSEFGAAGYSEVRTPTIEYSDVLEAGGDRGGPLYRFLDDRGELVALRNDMTVPVARLAASRMGDLDLPWRLCYLGSSFRTTAPQRADRRESGQAGVELFGVEGDEAISEVLRVLDRCLSASGVSGAVLVLGDSRLWPDLLAESGMDAEDRRVALDAIGDADFVGFRDTLEGSTSLDPALVPGLVELARTRCAREGLDEATTVGGEAVEATRRSLAGISELLDDGELTSRILFDFGMARDPQYYSGVVFEVFSPESGRSLGGGGRYDSLMGHFGMECAAAGFSLGIERIHEAVYATEAGR